MEKVKTEKPVYCPSCHGTRVFRTFWNRGGNVAEPCKTCNATGYVNYVLTYVFEGPMDPDEEITMVRVGNKEIPIQEYLKSLDSPKESE